MSNSYKSLLEALTVRAHLTEGSWDDLEKCVNLSPTAPQYIFNESCCALGETLGVNWVDSFNLPQKQVMRLIQMIGAISSKQLTHFDYTHARVLCAMRLAGVYDLNTDALASLASGTRDGRSNTRGITSSAVNQMFSLAHRRSTVDTKISNMTGKNGFSQVQGMTWANPGERNHAISMNHDHAVVKAFFKVIDGATLGQIDAMNAKGAKA
jgi:hypothetical protein